MSTHDQHESRPAPCPKCAGFQIVGCNVCGDGLVALDRKAEYQKAARPAAERPDAASGDAQSTRR